MTQYTRESIEGKGAWQLRSGLQEERAVPESHNLERENLGLGSVREDSGGQLRSAFFFQRDSEVHVNRKGKVSVLAVS